MSRSRLKNYGPQARNDFIDMVTREAAVYGLTKEATAPMEVTGDTVLIQGTAYPKRVAQQRRQLEILVKRDGFDHTMEAMAYTWFNRFMAIRYMELHGYLDHGYRVLSHPSGDATPEILQHAERIDLPGLDKKAVIDLKLDGTKDAELYRMLLLAQCNALQAALPFLFEELDDATELLLPADLLHSESVIRKMVEDIDEEDWQEVEIVGWLYQFYISEKKDQVIGKVVKSEDIPAATQLFTPNWIVKYMVQNSLGAQWLATYPQSPLKGQMEYYIEPAEQTDEVKAQLAAITPTQLNPEELTLIDPASGSGHILVEAYELFKAIYLERGYRQRDVPQLILEKNLFGLDIDERAAQLTGFALMMKGRADDRRLFERGVKLNVMALQDSTGFDAEGLVQGVKLADYGLKPGDLLALKGLFEHATTFGSLIQVPEGLAAKLPALKQLSEATSQNLFASDALKRLGPLVQQAELLAAQYDAVVANPPYMSAKHHNVCLKKFLVECFSGHNKNLFSAFMSRDFSLTKPSGFAANVTPFSWMFISSYEALRSHILDNFSMFSLVKPSYTSFFDSASVSLVTLVVRKGLHNYRGKFFDLGFLGSAESQPVKLKEGLAASTCDYRYVRESKNFKAIPGSPIAYWVSEPLRNCFEKYDSLHNVATPRAGMITGDNATFVRSWSEVAIECVGLNISSSEEARLSKCKWFPYQKGGQFRRWFGNYECLVDWEEDGRRLKTTRGPRGNIPAHAFNENYIFQPNVNWNAIANSFSARVTSRGALFDAAGSAAFPGSVERAQFLAGFLNSKISQEALGAINPTVNFQAWNIGNLPLDASLMSSTTISETATVLSNLAESDWNAYERSWDFQSLPILTASSDPTPTLESSYTAWITQNRDTIAEMKSLEEENNRLFIGAYGLADELTPDVPIKQVTLTVNPAYRYGGDLSEEGGWARFRTDTMQELISYAIGCMMGRYSLDAPGLIYAHSGNEGFDDSKYPTFPADDDGILPITDYDWFDDDIANRAVEFISVALPEEYLEENLEFLTDNLGRKNNESTRDCIRRYLSKDFFKDHLKTYKKRPIYWLFTSGKQKAFQCLVYLHRYNEGTLARMRTEYVIPLQSKMNARLSHLDNDIAAANSTSQRRKLEKERDTLKKQQTELAHFDEKLRHYADQRIHLDLDDGVKVNYGKFGDLLAEVKAITGKKPSSVVSKAEGSA
jgi:type II restriction/modification system DNA methylase subunit YeeA